MIVFVLFHCFIADDSYMRSNVHLRALPADVVSEKDSNVGSVKLFEGVVKHHY